MSGKSKPVFYETGLVASQLKMIPDLAEAIFSRKV
jgi:hypothetical protein